MKRPAAGNAAARTARSLLLVATASAMALTLTTARARATTQPETTYWISITLTDSKIVLNPNRTVKPGSLVVFNVQNRSGHARNLLFGADKTGFLAPGKKVQFELNFLLPWRITAVSVDRGGIHRLTATFVCTY
jgi:hypothetical protein